MSKGPLGYGRYNDDPECIGCPRARSDMTPCVARDGITAEDAGMNGSVCVGCRHSPSELLKLLVREVTNVS
jgi:hypothetical protein